eukprot:TRINITY_DN15161_c0_g1_i1.p1 TRINITY_DN15161_c0_g1~~TRINITY_DN15161_c0_g1_i1.p1  ORF type:complete len:272 (-),score=69.22 TRINITY_DN15161_c0_g1_i1:53-868(-)
MAPLTVTAAAQHCAVAGLNREQDWPVLGLEADWELVGNNSGGVEALAEFPADSDSDSGSSDSWAARAAKSASRAQVKHVKTPTQKTLPVACMQKKVSDLEEKEEQSTEDDEYLPDRKLLAREAHCRQAAKGGRHTLRAKIHCPVAKNSDVTVLAAGDAAPEALRQMPVREVVKRSGGSCRQVKTKEGRQAAISGSKMYDVRVPMSSQEADDVGMDVMYRVVEDSCGTVLKVRHPKYSAAKQRKLRSRSLHEQSKQVSPCEVLEGIAIAKSF